MVKRKEKGDLSSAFNDVKFQKKTPHLRVVNLSIKKKTNTKDEPKRLGFNDREFLERKKSLLKELYNEGRNSEFTDERQKFNARKELDGNFKSLIATKVLKKRRGRNFNLEDEEQDINLQGYHEEEPDFCNAINGWNQRDIATSQKLEFTHQGRPISAIDDTEIRQYNAQEELGDDEENKILDENTMPGFFFGQGDANGASTKSRQEIFKEIMLKSKAAKMEMRRHRESLEEELADFNDVFDQVQTLLSFKKSRKEKIDSLFNGNFVNPTIGNSEASVPGNEEIDEYDQIRSMLKFDSRSGVSDRIKTPEEIAKINAERLEKLEKERIERMSLNSGPNFEADSEGENEELDSGEEENKEKYEEDDESEQEDGESEQEDGESEQEGQDEGENESLKENEGGKEKNVFVSKNVSGFLLTHLKDIDWLVNDETEAELPYSVNLRTLLTNYTLEGLITFMSQFSPISQWKLLNRFRACFNKGDALMMDDLRLFFGFLVKYPLMCLREMRSRGDGENYFGSIIEYIKLMSSHLLFMAETEPKECLIIFSYFTLDICYSTFPGIYKSSKQIGKLLDQELLNIESDKYYTEILEECPSLYQLSDDIFELTLDHILICRIMFLIFPVSDAQHPFLTPIIICLEQWAHRWSNIGKSFLRTSSGHYEDKNSKYNHVRLLGNPNISCIIGVISLLETYSIGYLDSISNSENSAGETDNSGRFSIGFFSLSISCIRWILENSKMDLNERNLRILVGILRSLLRVVSKFKDTEGFHAVILHLVIGSIGELKTWLNAARPEVKDVLADLVNQLEKLSNEIVNRHKKPVQLCPRQVPTVRLLTPKIDDPSVPFAAKAMLRAKHSPKESRADFEKRMYLSRLKKEVNTARRQANRQLRKDSKVIADIWHENKAEKSRKQTAKYNSFIKMLEDDTAEYKRMKTTGGTMDTSIQSYRANKQKKKSNQRMGGNKTATGLVH
ncbi:Nucleolar protein 14 [Cryptosporidium felis]|nr:Nucleolar protein 14 [Cryptosporidium felis]